jgi:hypothetical protein
MYCLISALFFWFQRREVVAHHIAQTERNVIAVECLIGGVGVIAIDLIIRHGDLPVRVLSVIALLHRRLTGIRVKLNVVAIVSGVANALRHIDRLKLLLPLPVRVVAGCTLIRCSLLLSAVIAMRVTGGVPG